MSDTDTNQASEDILKSILGEIPNFIFGYLELSDDIRKEWKYGEKASDFGGHHELVQCFSKRILDWHNKQVEAVLDRLNSVNGFGCTHSNKVCDAVNLYKSEMRDAINAERAKLKEVK